MLTGVVPFARGCEVLGRLPGTRVAALGPCSGFAGMALMSEYLQPPPDRASAELELKFSEEWSRSLGAHAGNETGFPAGSDGG